MANVDRRIFLKLVGAGGVGAGAGFMLAESRKHPVEHLIPHPMAPEDFSAGVATWYNSVCTMCSAGCGISVRTLDGRAKKIEGNPSHPVSQGSLCALGQAGLHSLYNPDRLTGPMRSTGEGTFEPTTWNDGIADLGGRLELLRAAGRGTRVAVLTSGVRGHLGALFEQFADALGTARLLHYDFEREQTWHDASLRVFGRPELPYYDIANAQFVLSFGADFLGQWLSPVHQGIGYGESRQGRSGIRGQFVQIEPRMSLSGAAADEWVPANPGTEGVLALGLARRLVASGVYNGADRGAWESALAEYTPAYVAELTGVPEDSVLRLADAFSASQPGIAIGGGAAGRHTNGLETQIAVNVLNYLVGSVGREGGVIFNPSPAFGPAANRHATYRDMAALAESALAGEIDVLIINGANPIFNMPSAGFAEALAAIPFVASLSSFIDETSVHADLLLPSHTYLEEWADDTPEPGVGFRVASVQQPAVAPLYNTRGTGDILLSLAHEMGLDDSFAAPDMKSYLQDSWRDVYEQGAPVDGGFEAFWTSVVRAGVWGDETRADASQLQVNAGAIASLGAGTAEFAGAEGEYPFVLHPYITPAMRDGRNANLPWLQELPDPLTGVVYGSWIELNPVTAAELGVADGDVVAVQSPTGSIEAPVLVYSAIMPNVVAMPIGQGHTQYGRYASGRGVNPLEIVAPQTDRITGAHAWAATRVILTPTGRHVPLVRVGGAGRENGQEIVQIAAAENSVRSDATARLNSIPITVVNS